MRHLYAPDKNTIVAAGQFLAEPLIIRSTDAGASWNIVHEDVPQGSQMSIGVQDICFVNRNTGFVSRKDCILRSKNGGASWTKVFQNIDEDFYGIFFLDEQTGWVTGKNRMLQTTNGGDSWLEISRQTADKVYFIDKLNGYAAGAAFVKMTTDGGRSWQEVSNDSFDGSGGDIVFTDRLTGYATGNGGLHILKTLDGGITWQKMKTSVSKDGYYVIKKYDNVLMAGGHNGVLMRTDNGGGSLELLLKFEMITDEFCSSAKVKTNNASPRQYAFKWYLNGQLVSTDYNYIYRGMPQTVDTMKLVAVQGADSDSITKTYRLLDTIKPLQVTVNKTRFCMNESAFFKVTGGGYDRYHRVYINGVFDKTYSNDPGFAVMIPIQDTVLLDVVTVESLGTCGNREVKNSFMLHKFSIQQFPAMRPATDTICADKMLPIYIRNSKPGLQYFFDGGEKVNGTGGEIAVLCDPSRYPYGQSVGHGLYGWSARVMMQDPNYTCDAVYSAGDVKAIRRVADPAFTIANAYQFGSEQIPLTGISQNGVAAVWSSDSSGFVKRDSTSLMKPDVYFTSGGTKNIKMTVTTKEGCVSAVDNYVHITRDSLANYVTTQLCSVDTFVHKYYQYITRDITFDREGNRYVCGYLRATPVEAPNNMGQAGWFVAKWSASGKLLWKREKADSHYSNPHMHTERIGVDDYGNVFLSGHKIDFDYPKGEIYPNTIPEYSDDPGNFLMKLDAAGHIVWVRQLSDDDWDDQLGSSAIIMGKRKDLYLVFSDKGGKSYTFNGKKITSAGGRWAKTVVHLTTDMDMLDFSTYPTGEASIYEQMSGSDGQQYADRFAPARAENDGTISMAIKIDPTSYSNEKWDNISPGGNPVTMPDVLVKYDTILRKVTHMLPVFFMDNGTKRPFKALAYCFDQDGGYYAATAQLADSMRGFGRFYICRFSKDGQLIWQRQGSGLRPESITIYNNRLYVWGITDTREHRPWHQTQAGKVISSIYENTATSKGVRGYGYGDMVLASLGTDGTPYEITVAGNALHDYSGYAKADDCGNLWISGSTKSSELLGYQFGPDITFFLAKLTFNNTCLSCNVAPAPPFLAIDKSQYDRLCGAGEVTLTWSSNLTGTLKLSASSDDGTSYKQVATGIRADSLYYQIKKEQSPLGGVGGRVYYKLEDEGNSGLSDSYKSLVGVYPSTSFGNIVSTDICYWDTLTLRITPVPGNKYTWFNGDSVSLVKQYTRGAAAGQYRMLATTARETGCTVYDMMTISWKGNHVMVKIDSLNTRENNIRATVFPNIEYDRDIIHWYRDGTEFDNGGKIFHNQASPGTYTTRLEKTYALGCLSPVVNSYTVKPLVTAIEDVDPSRIDYQVFPNPTSANALVAYKLTTPANIQLYVTDVSGNIRHQVNKGRQVAGTYLHSLTGLNQKLGKGLFYVYLIIDGRQKSVRTLLVL
ncbi:YCF48-related protein [uncultured Chitinophaga sp.]|uniref:WD40/YVTN/BNR-like repeat-containing protein n=1 Tax=uncultured Chitinophaga sp. TaxID=339340 RepID=UPI0025F0FA39|nr:YCF48-related protein [uncultured Chitinophaga sp.]